VIRGEEFNGNVEDLEIKMIDNGYEVDMGGIGGCDIGWMSKIEPKLTNGFVTIVESEKDKSDREIIDYVFSKEPITYTEEEVKQLLVARNKEFSTNNELFNSLLLKQDLDWFENNKKK
jgi:hypothetical protein